MAYLNDRQRTYVPDQGRDGYRRDGGHAGRRFVEEAKDEVRSWFGDEEAERRRAWDERQNVPWGAGGRSDGDNAGRGYREGSDRTGSGIPGDNRDRSGSRYEQPRAQDDHGFGNMVGGLGHDGFRAWRDKQLRQFDRDYEEYQSEHHDRFGRSFDAWRNGRQGARLAQRDDSAADREPVAASDPRSATIDRGAQSVASQGAADDAAAASDRAKDDG